MFLRKRFSQATEISSSSFRDIQKGELCQAFARRNENGSWDLFFKEGSLESADSNVKNLTAEMARDCLAIYEVGSREAGKKVIKKFPSNHYSKFRCG